GAALTAHPLVTGFEEPVLDLVGDGGDVALAVAGDEQEHVDQRQRFGDVQRDEVLAALRIGRVSGDPKHLDSVLRGLHQPKAPVVEAMISVAASASASPPATIARVSMSLLPLSGAGGRMTSPADLDVLIAELAAIGVGEEAGASSPSRSTAS